MKALQEWTVEELQLEVASVSAGIAAASGRLLELVGELERRGAVDEGFRSLAHWLAWRTGLGLPAARENVRVARALRDLPEVSAALRNGDIGYSKARAITRVARPDTEVRLLDMARVSTAAQLERVVKGVRQVARNEATQSARIEGARKLTCYYDEDGMLVVRGRLSPEEGALVLRALDAAGADGVDRPAALARVADRSLARPDRRAPDRTQVVVHIDEACLREPTADGRSQIEAGPGVSAETSRRLACDCSLVVMAHDKDGEVVSVGRKTRVIPTAMRRALRERDRSQCRYPGCANRIVDGHHVKHWANGGATALANACLLCRTHHVLVHEGGYRMTLEGDRVRVFRPDGREVLAVPATPRVRPADPPAGQDGWGLAARLWADQILDRVTLEEEVSRLL